MHKKVTLRSFKKSATSLIALRLLKLEQMARVSLQRVQKKCYSPLSTSSKAVCDVTNKEVKGVRDTRSVAYFFTNTVSRYKIHLDDAVSVLRNIGQTSRNPYSSTASPSSSEM